MGAIKYTKLYFNFSSFDLYLCLGDIKCNRNDKFFEDILLMTSIFFVGAIIRDKYLVRCTGKNYSWGK